MTLLVTGATGTTGSRVTDRLERAGHPVRPVGRRTDPPFDWTRPDTHDAVLRDVEGVYLVPPVGVVDPLASMAPFIDRALDHGVRRFVLLSAAIIPAGGPGVGEVHALLAERAPQWAVLRPSWFMQNFARTDHYMGVDLREHGILRTSVEDGRIAFVDADDIADVAVHALTDREPHQRDHVITGPEALSYDDVAAVLRDVLGRRVSHERVDRATVAARMAASGIPRGFADMLAGLEEPLRAGAEDRVTDTVRTVCGRPPRSLRDWATAELREVVAS